MMLIAKERNVFVSSGPSIGDMDYNYDVEIFDNENFDYPDVEQRRDTAQFEVPCNFDRDGSRVCNCGFQNMVCIFSWIIYK